MRRILLMVFVLFVALVLFQAFFSPSKAIAQERIYYNGGQIFLNFQINSNIFWGGYFDLSNAYQSVNVYSPYVEGRTCTWKEVSILGGDPTGTPNDCCRLVFSPFHQLDAQWDDRTQCYSIALGRTDFCKNFPPGTMLDIAPGTGHLKFSCWYPAPTSTPTGGPTPTPTSPPTPTPYPCVVSGGYCEQAGNSCAPPWVDNGTGAATCGGNICCVIPPTPTPTNTPTPTPTPGPCSSNSTCLSCTNAPSCGWTGSTCETGTQFCPAGYSQWYYTVSDCDTGNNRCPPPTPTPTGSPTPTPTPVPCAVTTSPGVCNLSVGETCTVTASVTSGLGPATIKQMRFGAYPEPDGTYVATVNPVSDSTSIYSTTATGVAAGDTAVWATADLDDNGDGIHDSRDRTCETTGATDTNINVINSCPATVGTPVTIGDTRYICMLGGCTASQTTEPYSCNDAAYSCCSAPVPTPTSPAPTSSVPTPTPIPPGAGIENFYVYNDINANGTKDAGETYSLGNIQKWTCPCAVVPGGLCPESRNCSSISSGSCSFVEEKTATGSTPATFNIGGGLWHAERFIISAIPAGWAQTQPLTSSQPFPTSYWWLTGYMWDWDEGGQTCVQTNVVPPGGSWNFGLAQLYSISGNVFNDVDGNKCFNSPTPTASCAAGTETKYAGNIGITVVNNDTGVPYTVTNSGGSYTTDVAGAKKLPAGTYTVTFAEPLALGYSFTYPDPLPLRSLTVTVGVGPGPSCLQSGLESSCSGGNIVNLNAGVSNTTTPAWFQSIGSDMRWDAGFNNPLPSSNTYASLPGLGGMPGVIFSGGTDPSFGINGGKASKETSNRFNWQVGNSSYPDLFSGTRNLIPTSYNFLLETAQSSGITPANITTLTGTITHNIYKTSDAGLTVNAPVTFRTDCSSPPCNYIVLVDGNLNINANITVPAGSTAVFSAKGNVTVGANVTQIEGLYSADKDFVVDSASNCASPIGLADNPLNVEGTVVANAKRQGGSFVNHRDLCAGNLANPSVTFTERPDFMLNYPSMTKYTPRNWRDIAP